MFMGGEQSTNSDLHHINEELYKKNFELAIKNKTLSLLRRLYEVTTKVVEPEELARELTYAIRTSLSMEFVSVFLTHEIENEKYIFPIAMSSSEKFRDCLGSIEDKVVNVKIHEQVKNNLIAQVVADRTFYKTEQLYQLFFPYLKADDVNHIQRNSEIKTILLFPLIIKNRVLGVLVIAMDRQYDSLNIYEREAIESLVDVLSVALDKANMYKSLEDANAHLQELDRAKSEFMSIASHQLRTPLTGIIGYLSMVLEGDYGEMDSAQHKVIHQVFDASKRLVRLVNMFLNVTRIEAGRFTLNFTTLNFADVVNSEIAELLPTANQKGIKLSLDETSVKDIPVMVDTDKIRDVVLNLIDNAIKYTPAGSVTVKVSQEDNAHVRFAVKDTGVGVDSKEAKELFHKFVRGSGIARVQPNGSGLGLYIVKKIVEGHKGEVWMESDGEGKGSTFVVILPLKQTSEQFHAEPEAIFK